jgi:hypothetical protein
MTASTLGFTAESAEQEMAGAILDDLKSSPDEPNPEAPYGFTKEGTPRGKPGPKPGMRNRRKGSKAPHSRPASSSSSRPKPPPGPDYRAGIRGILQMIAAPLAIAGMKQPDLALDAATITLHADSVAEGVAEAALEIPQLQAILDRVMTVGPWGAAVAPVLALGAQIMANHNVIPPGTMGTYTREEILGHLHGLQAAA